MIELIVVVAAVVLLAAVVSPQLFSWLDEGRSVRAQSDAAAVGAAMSRFFQDTAKWPGQVEILEENSTVRFLTVGDPDAVEFPTFVGTIGIAEATCAGGGSGVIAGETMFADATPSAANSVNVLDFLSTPPAVDDYPNWKGPYITTDVRADPWGHVYIINVIPLFCSESVVASAPGGNLGFGWVMSAGANETLQTPFTNRRLAADVDDLGVTLGKRLVQGGT